MDGNLVRERDPKNDYVGSTYRNGMFLNKITLPAGDYTIDIDTSNHNMHTKNNEKFRHFFLEVFSHHNVDLRNELEERDQGIIAVEPHSDAPDWQAPVAEKAPKHMTGDEKYMFELK